MRDLSTIQKLFSIRNEDDCKVLYIFGVRFFLRSKSGEKLKKRVRALELRLEKLQEQLCRMDCIVGDCDCENLRPLRRIQELHSVPTIDRDAVNTAIEMMRKRGVSDCTGAPQLIISLTTAVTRIHELHYCVYSLLTQSYRPDAVILWLTKDTFPGGEADIPPKLRALQQWGLSIRWCDTDMGGFSKLKPAMREYPGAVVVAADENVFYGPDWLADLWKAYQASDKRTCIACQARRVAFREDGILPYSRWLRIVPPAVPSYHHFAVGDAGVLYPPQSLHWGALDDEKTKCLCSSCVDVWLWGMGVLGGTRTQLINETHPLRFVNVNLALRGDVSAVSGPLAPAEKDVQLNHLFVQYPGIKEKLKQEAVCSLKLSVIVPIYNAAKRLPACLDAILNQTLDRMEIICVNDGSVDESRQILTRYASLHDKIKVIHQTNQGAAAARNTGIKNASGEYIAFVDADDTIDCDYFRLLYHAAETEQAEVAMTDQVVVYEQDGTRGLKNVGVSADAKLITSIEDKGKIIIATGITWNKIYRRDYLKRYNIYFPDMKCIGEDNYFTVFSILHAERIAVNHKAVYNYLVHADSQTHVLQTRDVFPIIGLYKTIESRMMELPVDDIVKRRWLQIARDRKIKDYNALYNNMAAACKEEFRREAMEHIGTGIF